MNVSDGSDRTVWGITPAQAIVRYNGTGWTTVVGSGLQVSVGNASNVWVGNAAGTVYKWTGTKREPVAGAGLIKAVSAAPDGTVPVIRTTDNKVYRKP